MNSRRLLTGADIAAAGGRKRRCLRRKKYEQCEVMQAEQCDDISDRICRWFEQNSGNHERSTSSEVLFSMKFAYGE